jgi:hypothetical protein
MYLNKPFHNFLQVEVFKMFGHKPKPIYKKGEKFEIPFEDKQVVAEVVKAKRHKCGSYRYLVKCVDGRSQGIAPGDMMGLFWEHEFRCFDKYHEKNL